MLSRFDDEPLHNGADGKARRNAALNLLCARCAKLFHQCKAVALRVALDRGEVCACDVCAAVQIPADISTKLVRIVFRDLADAGILRRARFRCSNRLAAHTRPLSIWQLADAEAAAACLAAHLSLAAD